MTTSLRFYSDLLMAWQYDDDAPELGGPPRDRANHRSTYEFSDGTGSLQCNLLFHDRRRLTPASPTDLIDLGGELTDVFGNVLSLTVVKAIKVMNRGVPNASPATAWTWTAGEDIEIGGGDSPMPSFFGGASATGAEKLIVRSGGAMALIAPHDGYAVTPNTADILRISLEGSGNADVDYDLIIAGN